MPTTILRVEDLPNIPQLTSGALFYASQSGQPYNVSYLQINNNITGGGGTGGGGTVNNYINSGSGLFIFQTQITSGISGQFISFPTSLGNNPFIVNSLQNNNLTNIFGYQISGTSSSGYWIMFSDFINDTGFFLNTFAMNSTGTGLATLIINNLISGANNTVVTGLSGVLNTTGSNLYGYIVGLSGNLNSTGTNLQNQINNINTSLKVISGRIGVTGVNGITGGVNLVGQGTVAITTNGQNINISGAAGAGVSASGLLSVRAISASSFSQPSPTLTPLNSATSSIVGVDSAFTVNWNPGTTIGGTQFTINFGTAFPNTPVVIFSPGSNGGNFAAVSQAGFITSPSASSFTFSTNGAVVAGQNQILNFIVIG